MSATDRDYFEQRAEEETARAQSAASEAATEIHLALAAKYRALVEMADARPMLHVAWDEGARKQA
ncbi:MAG TPA: hypothetical protein VFW35_07920 [Sphingomicrobium sp.]|nr:hypothetical protein [Sphingomicrobium sp.]